MEAIPMSKGGRTAIEVARELAVRAGEILRARFHSIKSVETKGRANIVTDVDLEVERAMFAILADEYPEMATLGEESSGSRADAAGYVWILDPLDGTRNYASGIPFYSVVAGLARDGEVLLGVNYDPSRDEMFEAERGKGAFLNGRPIRVSEKPTIADSVLGLDLSYDDDGAANTLGVILSLWPGIQTARVMGSAALGIAYAAAGRSDLYFHYRLEPWDQVTGLLLVREAGGVVTDRRGRPAGLYSDGIVASSATLHAEFLRLTDGAAFRAPA